MELTSLPYFHFPRRRCFLIYLLTIQWQAVEIKVRFDEMFFEQSVHLPESDKITKYQNTHELIP